MKQIEQYFNSVDELLDNEQQVRMFYLFLPEAFDAVDWLETRDYVICREAQMSSLFSA